MEGVQMEARGCAARSHEVGRLGRWLRLGCVCLAWWGAPAWAQGVGATLEAPAGQAKTEKTPQSPTGYAFASAQVVARAGEAKITEADLDYGRFFVEYLLGAPLDEADAALLRADQLAEFQKSPQAFLKHTHQAKQLVEQIHGLPNGLHMGVLRSHLVAQLYPQRESAAFKQVFEWFQKYNPILHYDAHNTAVLTRADLVAVQHLLAFETYLKLGQMPTLSAANVEENIQLLIQRYQRQDLSFKTQVAGMQYLYLQVMGLYQRMSAQEKRALVAQMRQQWAAQQAAQTQAEVAAGAGQVAPPQQALLDATLSRIIDMGNISRHNLIESMGAGKKTFYSLNPTSPLAW